MSVATTIVKGDVYTGKAPMRVQPLMSAIIKLAIPIVFPVAAPVANDTHALCKIPQDAKVVDWTLISDDVDSNGAPTAAWSLGVLNADLADLSAVVYKTAIVIGQTGGLLRCADAVPYLASAAAERIIGLKWTTAAATYAASKTGLLILELAG